MDFDQVAFLCSEAGRSALDLAATFPNDRLTRIQRLRRTLSASQAAGAVELLELRHRARAKFSHADRMFFTPEGLEQSTGERIANYRASRFPLSVPILDACCGNGGDALALASRERVLLVDQNPTAVACAKANLATSEVTHHQTAPLCADVTTLHLTRLRDMGFRAAFFDPSRRIDTSQGRRRAKDAEDYLPPLSWVEQLTARFPFVAVKVSPAIDDETLAQVRQHHTSPRATVEFLADGNECKEAVLWFDADNSDPNKPDPKITGEDYRATVLHRDGTIHTLSHTATAPLSTSEPRAWLYEPNPAVIRAHLIPEVAAPLNGTHLDSQIAYFAADIHAPTPFATAYRILDWMPYNLKNLRVWLRTHQYRVEVVKRRGVPFEPEETRKQLASSNLTECPPIVLVLTHQHNNPIALLCSPPE